MVSELHKTDDRSGFEKKPNFLRHLYERFVAIHVSVQRANLSNVGKTVERIEPRTRTDRGG